MPDYDELEPFMAYPEGIPADEFAAVLSGVIARLRDAAVRAGADTVGPRYGEQTPGNMDKAVVALAGCLVAAAGVLMEERLGTAAAEENLRRLLARMAGNVAGHGQARH